MQRTGTAEPITTTKQNTGTTQQANTANGAPTKQNAAPATKAVVPTTNNNKPQATDPAQTIVGNQTQPAPMHASPVDSGRTPVEQPQAEQPKAEQPKPDEEKLITKAKTNEKLKTVVKQAFVDGDEKAQQLLNSQHINPKVLEAVKGMVIPNYVPQGNVNTGANARTGVQTVGNVQAPTTNTQNANATTQNATAATGNTQNSTTENAQNGSAVQNSGSDNTSNGAETPVKGKKSRKNGGKKAAKTPVNKAKTPVEDKETTETKKDEPSKDTSKSNTEEKTNETTKEIRELLPETNKDKHGDTKSEEGSKSEGEDREKAETKDTVTQIISEEEISDIAAKAKPTHFGGDVIPRHVDAGARFCTLLRKKLHAKLDNAAGEHKDTIDKIIEDTIEAVAESSSMGDEKTFAEYIEEIVASKEMANLPGRLRQQVTKGLESAIPSFRAFREKVPETKKEADTNVKEGIKNWDEFETNKEKEIQEVKDAMLSLHPVQFDEQFKDTLEKIIRYCKDQLGLIKKARKKHPYVTDAVLNARERAVKAVLSKAEATLADVNAALEGYKEETKQGRPFNQDDKLIDFLPDHKRSEVDPSILKGDGQKANPGQAEMGATNREFVEKVYTRDSKWLEERAAKISPEAQEKGAAQLKDRNTGGQILLAFREKCREFLYEKASKGELTVNDLIELSKFTPEQSKSLTDQELADAAVWGLTIDCMKGLFPNSDVPTRLENGFKKHNKEWYKNWLQDLYPVEGHDVNTNKSHEETASKVDETTEESNFESPFDISDEGIAKAEADLDAAFGFDAEEETTPPETAKAEKSKATQEKTHKAETAKVEKAPKEEAPYSEETDTIEDFSITGLDISDEALERYKKEFEDALAKSAHRLNSNPVFDPNIWIPAFKIGAVCMARGVKTLAEFKKKLVAIVGEKIEPWVKSVWEALKRTPKGMKYSDEQLTVAIRFAGSKYFAEAAKGNDYTLEQLQADFKKRAKTQANYDKFKDLLPMVHAAVANYQKTNGTPAEETSMQETEMQGAEAKETAKDTAPTKEDKEEEKAAKESNYHGYQGLFNPKQWEKIEKVLQSTVNPFGESKRGLYSLKHAAELMAQRKNLEFDNRKHTINGDRFVKEAYDYAKWLYENEFDGDTIATERSKVDTKEDENVSRGVSRPSGPVEMGRPGESGTNGKGTGENAGGDSTGKNRKSGQEHAGDTGSAEPASKGKAQGESRGAGTGNAVEQNVSNGDETGGTEKPVISKKADKVEADIAAGKVKDARDVPGNSYTLKPTNEIKNKKERVKKNIEAIKLLKKIESENRKATPAEQEILASYSGWGSLTFALDETMADYDPKVAMEIKSILTEQELADIKAEMTTAYYTPHNVVKAMWNIAEKLGFKGGRVLDPSCGAGTFFGLMPANIRAKCTAMQGIDLSSLPARIAAQLYQGKGMRIDNMGFEKFNTGDNFYDLAITNVPFADIYPSDKSIKNSYKIHNYFFAKAMQKVRPGGLIMFMTSSSTMDGYGDAGKLRSELSAQADLVGVIRMPSSLFNNAGAKVTTDIIILRKVDEGEYPNQSSWDGYVKDEDRVYSYTIKDEKTGEETQVRAWSPVNQYFNDHPENVIGVPTDGKARWSRVTDIVVKDNADMEKRLATAIKGLPDNIYIPRSTTPTNSVKHVRETIDAGEIGKDKIVGNIIKGKDGKYGRVAQDKATGEIYIKPYAKDDQARIEKLVEVRDALDDVLESQVNPEISETELETKRENLSKAYDDFTRKYGCLNDYANTSLLGDVPQIGRVLALENYTAPKKPGRLPSEKKKAKGTAKKADIFTKRTAYPANQEIKVTTSADAFLSSLQQFGYVNMDYMANALGKSKEGIAKELEGKIIKDPVSEQYVPMDEYLSENVRQKLAFAEEAAKTDLDYTKNIDALKKVIPEDVKIEDIDITLGSPAITPEDVQAFVNHLVGVDDAIDISYEPNTARWTVKRGRNYRAISAQIKLIKYGVKAPSEKNSDVYVEQIIDAMLKGTDVSSIDSLKVSKDAAPKELEASQNGQLKALAIRDGINKELAKWILSDAVRAKRVADAYNYKFNATVLRKYDGSFLKFPWMNAAAGIHLRAHQVNAIWKTLHERAVLYAHCVGSGKTWTMQAAGMELKRLGLAHKIVYTTPKNVVKQFEREFYTLCPNAKILVLDSDTLPSAPKHIEYDEVPVKEERNGKMVTVKLPNGLVKTERKQVSKAEQEKRRAIIARRNATMMKIKTEDWDAIIMSHETFGNLPVAEEYLKKFINGELIKYERALNAAKDEKASKRTIRDLQMQITQLQARLEKITDQSEKMQLGSDTFETLGIDQLFVDEADVFKNLQFTTTMGNIRGLSNSYSIRAEDMYLKVQYLLGSPSTHGVVFATGTPISNSIVELYTMCRYMAGRELERLGIDSFDQFAKMFVRIGQGEVPKQDGTGYEYKNKVLGLRNAPECARIFKQFADVQTVEDLPYIAQARPKATYVDVAIDETDWLKKFKREIRERVNAFNPKDPPMRPSNSKESQDQIAQTGKPIMVPDGYLPLSNDFRNASLSPKIVDRNVSDEEGLAKVYACAEHVLEEYKNSSDRSGAQLVFCDQSTPDGNPNHFSVYPELKRRLVELGIPENEIAFVHDANTDEKQAKLFQAVNEGKIRVLIGSTGKMGAGTNMQKKLVALHHLDCPWRPRDIEQREGRILRQGNENKEVRIYRYVQKGSYDANVWNTIRGKAAVINQVMHGDPNVRTADTEGIDSGNFFELEKLANADPDQKRYLEVTSRLRTLEAAKTTFETTKEHAARVLKTSPAEVETIENQLKDAKDDVAALQKTDAKAFAIKIDGKVYTDNKAANEAMSAVKEKLALDWARYLAKAGNDAKMQPVKVGEVRGFEIFADGGNRKFRAGGISSNIEFVLKRKLEYPVATATALGSWTALQTTPFRTVETLERKLKVLKRDIDDANSIVEQDFTDEKELADLTKEAETLKKRIAEKAAKQAEEDARAAKEEAMPTVDAEFLQEMDSNMFNFDDLDDFSGLVNKAFAQSFIKQYPEARSRYVEGGLFKYPGYKVQFALSKIEGWETVYNLMLENTDWTLEDEGDRVIVTAKTEDTDQLDGFSSFLITDENTRSYTKEEMEAQVLEQFPGAKDITHTENGVTFTLPNGEDRVTFNFTDGTIAVDKSQAKRDYGHDVGDNARGSITTCGSESVMTLQAENVEQAPAHEAMHLAQLFLTDREKAALNRAHGGNIEAICEAHREWKIKRAQRQGTLLGKIHQHISEIANRLISLFYLTDKEVFRRVADGEVWERKKNNVAAKQVHYLMVPENAIGKFLEDNKGPKGFVKAAEQQYKNYTAELKETVKESFKENWGENPVKDKEVKPGISVRTGSIRTNWTWKDALRANTGSASRIVRATVQRVFESADNAMRTRKELADKWTKLHTRALKSLETKALKQEYNRIMLAEDLEQHEYSDAELKKMGVSKEVIAAHAIVRNLMKSIYKAVNETYIKPTWHNARYVSRAEAEEEIRMTKGDPNVLKVNQIKEVKTKDGTVYQVSIKSADFEMQSNVEMSAAELKTLKEDPRVHVCKTTKLENGAISVTYKRYVKHLTNTEGYLPHIFHDFLVIRKDENGNTEVVGSGKTQAEAVAAAERVQEKYPESEFLIAAKTFQFQGELQNTMVLGDKAYHKLLDNVQKGTSMTLDEAKELLKARKKGRTVFFGALKQRKGATGYEENVPWVVQHHIDAAARYVALTPFKRGAISFFERAYGDFNKHYDPTSEAGFVRGYIDSMLGKPATLADFTDRLLRLFPVFKNMSRPGMATSNAVLEFSNAMNLGLSACTALTNFFQIFNCVLYTGSRMTVVGIKRAMHPTESDLRILRKVGMDEEVGLMNPWAKRKPYTGTTKLEKAFDWYHTALQRSLWGFAVVDQACRRATVLAAYYSKVKELSPKGEITKDVQRDALKHARDINRKVNFDYSMADSPRIFRALRGTVLGDIALQFQKYGVKEMEVILDALPLIGDQEIPARRKVEFFVPYLLFAGIWKAFPAEGLLLWLIGLITGEDPEKAGKRAVIEWAGNDPYRKMFADAANYGVLSTAGLGTSSSVGLRSAYPEFKNPLEGAALSKMADFANALHNGDSIGAWKSALPALRHIVPTIAGYNTDKNGRKTIDYTYGERAVRFFGFTPTREQRAVDAQGIAGDYKNRKTAEREKAKEAYFDDPSDKNYQKLRDLGYSKTDIKGFKNSKNTTRTERAESGLSKDDKEKLKSVFDYAK